MRASLTSCLLTFSVIFGVSNGHQETAQRLHRQLQNKEQLISNGITFDDDRDYDHWTPPQTLNLKIIPPTPAPTDAPTRMSISENSSPTKSPAGSSTASPTSNVVAPSDNSATASNNFGAGPAVAIGLGGAILLGTAMIIGRRRMKQADEPPIGADGKTDADASTQDVDLENR